MRSKVLKVLSAVGITFILSSVSALLTLAVTETGSRAGASEPLQVQTVAGQDKYNPHNLIRFHVIANSDGERDQAMKRKVRDLIVEHVTPEFAKARNLDEARIIADQHLAEIKTIAENEVKAWGADYQIQVMRGTFDFPVKTYGQLTLPAGSYEAVRVVIGQGQGANWWCVLFPPLCFVDVSKSMAPAEDNSTAAVMVPAEIGLVGNENSEVQNNLAEEAEENQDQEQVKIKFKIFELLDWF